MGPDSRMRVTSLGSGSSGNALLVEAGPRGRTKLLVDAGFRAAFSSNASARWVSIPRICVVY